MRAKAVLSSDFQKISMAGETDEVIIALIELHHKSLDEPIRISSDSTELYGYDEESGTPIYCTRHQGKVYFQTAFSFVPPGSPDEGSSPQAKFVVAMHKTVLQAIRNVHEGITLQARFVFASNPDEVFAEIPELYLKSISYSASQIEATLSVNHFMDEPCGKLRFMPSYFPALFKNGVVAE